MTPTTYLDRLRALGACSDAVSWCRKHHPTDLRAAWEDCPDGRWMLWLLVRLDRRRGVGVTVEVVRALSAHLAPDEVTIDVLNPLAAWAAGDESVDVVAVRARAWEIRRSVAWSADAAAWSAVAVAAAVAWSAVAVADAAAAAAAWSAVAWSAAADAAAWSAAADADADAAAADMIRDLVPADEVERLLMEGTR